MSGYALLAGRCHLAEADVGSRLRFCKGAGVKQDRGGYETKILFMGVRSD